MRRRRMLHPAHHLGHRVVATRNALTASQHVVEDQAERIDVRAVVHGLALAPARRHVFERSHHRAERGGGSGAAHRSRDPEVHDQRAAVGGDHDVLGLQIAMDDADLVRRGEPATPPASRWRLPREPEPCPGASGRRQGSPLRRTASSGT